MHNLKFVVRWTDQDGKNHRREYSTEKDARKAKDWLTEKGAPSVDIAISTGGREVATKPSEASMFPAKQPTQQGLI